MLIGSLTQRPEPIEDGREFVRRVFADWTVQLRDGGLLEAYQIEASWAWLTVEETRRKFRDSPWLDVHGGCPFVGPPMGYLLVEDICGSHDDWDDVLSPLIKEGRGIVASTVTDEFHISVTRQRLPLDDVLGKSRLDDGAMLLERVWGPYQAAIFAEFERALAAAGWDNDPPLHWMPTAHNSWRWDPSAAGFDSEQEVMERFGHIEVDLWLYDFDAESLIVVPDGAANVQPAPDRPANGGPAGSPA